MKEHICGPDGVCVGGRVGEEREGFDDPLLELFFSLRLTRMVGASRRFGAQLGDQQGRAPRRACEAWSKASQRGRHGGNEGGRRGCH